MIVDTRQVAAALPASSTGASTKWPAWLPRQVDAFADQVRPLLEEFKSGRG